MEITWKTTVSMKYISSLIGNVAIVQDYQGTMFEVKNYANSIPFLTGIYNNEATSKRI